MSDPPASGTDRDADLSPRGPRPVVGAGAGAEVYDDLADFTTTNEWDPRASSTHRASGGGEEGSTYRCRVALLGRSIPMLYTTTRLVERSRIEWVGTSRLVRAHDVVRLRPDADGLTVDYTMRVQFERAPRTWDALLCGPVRRLAAEVEEGLRRTLHARFAQPQPAGR